MYDMMQPRLVDLQVKQQENSFGRCRLKLSVHVARHLSPHLLESYGAGSTLRLFRQDAGGCLAYSSFRLLFLRRKPVIIWSPCPCMLIDSYGKADTSEAFCIRLAGWLRYPYGSKDPNNKVLGPKYH